MDEQELKYRINVDGDDSGAKKVQESLQKLISTSRTLDKEKLEGFLKHGAEFATFSAAVELAVKSLEEYAHAEERVVSMNAALAQRDQLNNKYSASLQRLAAAQQELTGVSKSDWIEAITALTQAGAKPENIEKLIEATKNLSGVTGGDLRESAFALGKALNGNFEQFTRLGIVFDEHATRTEKLAKLEEELAARGGGQLEARNQTLTGSFKTLSNSVLDVMGGMGDLADKILGVRRQNQTLANILQFLSSLLPTVIRRNDDLKNSAVATGTAMRSQEDILRQYAKGYEGIRNAAGEAAVNLERALSAIRATADQEKGVLSQKADAQLKRIDADEKSGAITPLRAAELRNQVKTNLDKETFAQENKARGQQIEKITQTADVLTSQVDQANRESAEKQQKLRESGPILAQRRKLQEEANKKVDAAKAQYGAGSKEHITAVGAADFATRAFDMEYPDVNPAELKFDADAAKDKAAKANKEIYPQATSLRAQALALQREQAAEMRKHGWSNEANRLDQYAALKEAREKERGDVKVGDDGSLTGTPAALRVKQQSDALSAATPQFAPGTQGYQAQLRARDNQISQLQNFIQGMLRMPTLMEGQQNQIRAALDRINVLEAQLRNNPNR